MTLPILVANYLRSSGFDSTLAAFLQDSSIDRAILDDLSPSQIDLRDLVELYNIDKLKQAQLLAKVEVNEEEDAILESKLDPESTPARVVRTFGDIHAANVLSVLPVVVPRRTFDTSTAE